VAQPSGVPRFSGKRVLLVEDNLINQKVGAALLGKLGCGVDVAANGRQALHMAARLPYDLIFMDCQMPEMDGYQASNEIRKTEGSERHTPIIALTAAILPEDRERCARAGMDDYLSKPVGPADLAAVLERWLAKCSPETTKPVFERAAFLSRIMGDEGLARTIMGGFLDDMPAQIEKLAVAVAAGDIRKVELQAHQIKGASASVGGEALRGAAGEMEETSKTGRVEALGALLSELKERFAQLKEMMEKDAGGYV
jgi:CheY-like chemotaxis protein/HPt (histidine-containing phosphotransfer) domain-containing protein